MNISNTQSLQKVLSAWNKKDLKTALVPTMGGLHAGHLSLIKIAKKYSDRVIVSIFVNPAQFALNEDFSTYPRVLDNDLILLKKEKVDLVFTPEVNDIYPDEIKKNINIGELDRILCSKTRPHFFTGVLQAVTRLFEIISPNYAIFGQKDYQQLKIIEKYSNNVKIISAPIIREKDNLAMSTRNLYLTHKERQIAPKLYQIIYKLSEGKIDKNQAIQLLEKYFRIDYLEILDADNLKKISYNSGRIIILVAVFLGKNRLIDNIILGDEKCLLLLKKLKLT
jgi:pantoate--beta-alanine ligase